VEFAEYQTGADKPNGKEQFMKHITLSGKGQSMKHITLSESVLPAKRPIRSASAGGSLTSIAASTAFIGLVLFILTAPTPGFAEEDNTGTNPVNFTYDFRLYREMAELPGGGGSRTTSIVELRAPLGRDMANLRGEGPGSLFYDMGKMFQLRFRAPYQDLSVTTPGAAPFNSSEVSGIGDFDARLLSIAYASETFILAPGLEAFFDTATNDALGSGKTSLAPVIFGVFPGMLGGRSLFAPGYQYVFDICGDGDRADISRSQIDLYFVWLLAQGKNWLILDPQIILDHEATRELATVEAEWGFMIAPSVGTSAYLRPGVGIGAHRPYSWNFEVGLKFVWR
jgi:hypothetical protein